MGEFTGAVFALPAVLFTFALAVMVGYWVLVLLGGVRVDALGTDADAGDGIGAEGAAGLGGIGRCGPLVADRHCLVHESGGFRALERTGLSGPADTASRVVVLGAALALSWAGTRLLVRNRLPDEPVMDDAEAEMDAVVADHCAGEAQTLTPAAEADLLRLAEPRGTSTREGAARRAGIKAAYGRDRKRRQA